MAYVVFRKVMFVYIFGLKIGIVFRKNMNLQKVEYIIWCLAVLIMIWTKTKIKVK